MSITHGISKAGLLQLAKDAMSNGGSGPYTLTYYEYCSIVDRYGDGPLTPDDRLALSIESDTQLVIGAEDHDPTKLAQAAGRALICNALANINCTSLKDAIDAYDHMRFHA